MATWLRRGAVPNITSLSLARLALKKSKDTRGAFKPIEPWALSMAGWNVIASVLLAGIWVAAALRKA